MEPLLQALRAVAEPTRLRLVAALRSTELSVSELCRVVNQSQPRVSRHLKLLDDAGVVDRHAQGTSAYYRISLGGVGAALVAAIEELIDQNDLQIRRDAERVEAIRAERAAVAAAYFEEIASDWEAIRSSHVSDEAVEQAMLDAAGTRRIGDLLDIGTGTGRMLEVFADRASTGLGIDLSPQMLNLARSRIETAGLRHCAVRHGNCYDTEFDPGSFDTAVLHHVLHFLDDPAASIAEAARTLRPGGRLIIVDFAPHERSELIDNYSHRHLGFTDEMIETWCTASGLVDVHAEHLSPSSATGEDLTVSLWIATQHPDAPSTYRFEAAS